MLLQLGMMKNEVIFIVHDRCTTYTKHTPTAHEVIIGTSVSVFVSTTEGSG